MSADELLDSFVNYLRIERGLADNTVEAYSRDLTRFSEFLEEKSIRKWEKPNHHLTLAPEKY